MKTALIVLVSCASFSFAQDMKIAPPAQTAPPKAESQNQPNKADSQDQPAEGAQLKRLATVTWDLNSHKLVWTVEKGEQVNGQFVPKSTDRYEVSPSEAYMSANAEKRGIETEEANSLHELLNVLSLYCVESTVWWENGGGASADRTADPPKSDPPSEAKPGKKSGTDNNIAPDPNAKPTRIEQQQQQKKPAAPRIPGANIANAQ